MTTKKPKTAAELLSELQRAPEFVAGEKLREAQTIQKTQALQDEQGQLLTQLGTVGIFVESVWDLVNSKRDYSAAIPILARHLPLPYSKGIKEGVVRALTLERAGPMVLHELIREFLKQNDDSETSLKWILGNAIATVATSADSPALIDLATNPSHGRARDMIVLALPRVLKDRHRLNDVLLRLERDKDVGEFARQVRSTKKS
jgi:hypothetical protein